MDNSKEVLSAFDAYRECRIRLTAALSLAGSQRDPLTEFGEWLVARLVGGRLASSRTQKGHDVLTATGDRIQVKTLANPTRVNRNGVTVKIEDGMDLFAVVFFEDFSPRAVVIFRPGSFKELNRSLGNRPRKADPERTLALYLRHVPILIEKMGAISDLGASLYHPNGLWISPQDLMDKVSDLPAGSLIVADPGGSRTS